MWWGFTALAGLLVAATPAAAEPAVWTVRDADSTIVLFGSIHVLPRGMDWRPDALDAALDRADDLWFETDVGADRDAESGLLARREGTMPGSAGLIALLTPQGRDRLYRIAGRLGFAPAALDGFKPWLADVTLSVAALAAQGAGVNDGVERTLIEAAPRAERRTFETSAEQIAFFAGAPMADQLASLEDTLRQIDEDPGYYDRLIQAWAAGDTRAIEALGLDPLRALSPILYDRLIVQRNRRWAEVIRQRLAGAGETVIVVGAGHLVGKDSVPALLRAEGVAVEGP
ncbi:MAG: TraB/GumN family protein [Pseudomonadota bacterium]